jgi:PAS domain S-box-containing protein
MKINDKSHEELKIEVEKLRAQLAEADETLRAIRSGEVDALVVSGEKGEQVFTLKGAEQPYRILIEEMREGAAMLAADDTILYCNSSFASILKTPLEKLIGTGIAHYIAPADEVVFLERQERERSSRGEITLLAGDGTFVSTLLSLNTLQMDDAQFVYLVVTDLTEQKRIRDELRRARDELEIRVEERTEELRESEQLWATTLTSIGDAVISTDGEGRITFMNAVAEALTGWALAEASTKPVTEIFNIINEFTRREADNPVSSVLHEGKIVGLANHTILVRKDGTEVPIDDSAAPIRDQDGKAMGVVLVFRDITERKMAEKKIEHLASFPQMNPNPVIEIDDNGTVTFSNEATAQVLKTLDIEDDARIFLPADFEEIMKALELKKEIQPFYREVVLKNRIFAEIVYISKKLRVARIYVLDITLRKRAEGALRKAHDELEARVRERTAELQEANKALLESEASYRELTESIDDPFYAIDGDLRYTYWNKASEAITGILAKDAIGKSLYELFPGIKGTKAERFYIDALKTQQHERFESEYKVGGKRFIFEINAYSTKTGHSVIAKDITEKKKLEAQLLRAQRLESVGTLAGGIAHDLNNVLTPMMLSLQILKEKFKDEQSQKLLTILEKNSQRGADLIKQVLSFARGVEGERNPLQAKHLISEIEKIAKETFPRTIEIMTDVPKDLFTISGDATQLYQVIMNLCVNARDAMPDGGILSISAENFFIDETYVQGHTEAKVGSYLSIAVSDTGIGIPPEVLERIFEPFFTTKEFGKGTGLGLSTALAIVKSHGGFINVYSEVGKGTTFRVYLPAIKTEIKNGEEQHLELTIGQGELIMVAEDEDSIREVTASTLEEYGYNVLKANDGADAVALYAQNKDKINVILMDLMMPVMDGHASIRAIRKINPGIKIIAVSGLAEKNKLAKIADTRVQAFLPKPYTAERLLKTLRDVIGTE